MRTGDGETVASTKQMISRQIQHRREANEEDDEETGWGLLPTPLVQRRQLRIRPVQRQARHRRHSNHRWPGVVGYRLSADEVLCPP